MAATNNATLGNRNRLFSLNPLLLALASAGLVAVGPAAAANFTVNSTGDSGSGSLRQAISDANGNGDPSNTIDFNLAPGATITLTGGQIAVSKTLTITGPGNNGITISGNNADRIFDVAPASSDVELSIEGLTLRDGRVTGVGGCIRALSDANYIATVSLNNSVVTGCTAEATGGANFTLDFGGGPFALEGMGGGIFASSYSDPPSTSLRLTDSTVSGNTARVSGGGVLASQAEVVRSRVSNNTVLGGQTTLQDGGGPPVKYLLFFTGAGGGMLSGPAILTDSTVSGNTVNAIVFNGISGPPTNAFQTGNGGGLTTFGQFEIRGSTVSGNTVRSRASNAFTWLMGGGVSSFDLTSDSASLLSDSTISGNVVDVSPSSSSDYSIATGGGMSLSMKYDLLIENSTISGNRLQAGASQPAGGLGSGLGLKYLSSEPGTITLNSTIVGGNTSTGSFVNSFGTYGSFPALRDLNIGTPDPTDALTIAGANNLVTTVDSRITLPGDTLSSNPQLAPLANQGGVVSGAAGGSGTAPNQTMALYQGSPAIDTGNNLNNLDYDQRGIGYPRVTGASADIGAFEGSIPRPLQSVPTLGTLGLGLLSTLLGMAGIAIQRLRRRPSSSG